MNVALTIHRIQKDNIIDYEDISTSLFSFLINRIKKSCIAFGEQNNLNQDVSWVLTFDDGFSSDYEIALPLLMEKEMQALFFIVPSYVGRPNYLTWKQIKSLSDNGMEIGSHSLNHVDMVSVSKLQRMSELNDSRKIIEDQISKSIRSFSFPFGQFNNEVIKDVFDSGYEYCFTSKPGNFNSEDKIIPRISLNGTMTSKKVNRIINNCEKNKIVGELAYNLKSSLKKVFGMRVYWILRKLIIQPYY
tara:strand:- start:307 stop:1044 length:738 start_codon:yes stop_codon:yes gene_type:complete